MSSGFQSYSFEGRFKAIGLPIILIVTVVAGALLNYKKLISTHQAVKGTKLHVLFIVSLINAVLAMFLFFTAGWYYGVMCAVVAYFFGLLSDSQKDDDAAARQLVYLLGVWLLILSGLPAGFSDGVIDAVSGDCLVFYGGTIAQDMCVNGWLNFALFIALWQIAVTFLSLMTLISAVFGTDSLSDAVSLPGGGGGGGASNGGYNSVD